MFREKQTSGQGVRREEEEREGTANNRRTRALKRKCCRTDTARVLDLEVTQVVSSNLQSVLVEQL